MTDRLIMRRPAQFRGGNRDTCDTQSLDSIEDDVRDVLGRVAWDPSLVVAGAEQSS